MNIEQLKFHQDEADSSAVLTLTTFLNERGVEFELLEPGCPMPTVLLAAAAIGVEDSQIIKTLVFKSPSGECLAAIASGTARIDRGRLAAFTGHAKLKLADPKTVLEATGFPAGGVAPVGHATALRVVVDSNVMDLEYVYGGGGSEDMLVRLRPTDIVRLTGAEIADIVAPDETESLEVQTCTL
jgi:Cys-tRNA(Pro) deacylase